MCSEIEKLLPQAPRCPTAGSCSMLPQLQELFIFLFCLIKVSWKIELDLFLFFKDYVMNILFVNSVARNTPGYHTISTKIPQLGLKVLAYATPKEHNVDICDEIFGSEMTYNLISSGKYDLVAVTAMTSGAPRAYEIAEFCREQGVPAIFGGIHASLCTEEAKKYFDTVIVGEADELWPEVVRDFERGELKKIYLVDKLPELGDKNGRADQEIEPANGRYHVASLQTSRGCPIGCKFCSVTKFNGPRIRRRSIDSIVDEWNSITKSFVFIVDDNFFGVTKKQAEWSKELLREIIKRGKRRLWFSQTSINMGEDTEALTLAYKAGCRAMLVGLESFDEGNLVQYNKKLNHNLLTHYKRLIDTFHKCGIAVFGGVIIGADNDGPDTIFRAGEIAAKLGVDIVQLTNLTPLPGTKLFEEFRDEGRLIVNDFPKDWEKFTFIETVFNPKKMTAEELDESIFLLRRGGCKKSWVYKRTIKSLFRTRSLSTALFVHGMNIGFYELAKVAVKRDSLRFPHLLRCKPPKIPA